MFAIYHMFWYKMDVWALVFLDCFEQIITIKGILAKQSTVIVRTGNSSFEKVSPSPFSLQEQSVSTAWCDVLEQERTSNYIFDSFSLGSSSLQIVLTMMKARWCGSLSLTVVKWIHSKFDAKLQRSIRLPGAFCVFGQVFASYSFEYKAGGQPSV